MIRYGQYRKLSFDNVITIGNDKDSRDFNCALCLDHASRALGLMGQKLSPGQGCFFDFKSQDTRDFWMKDCIIDLVALFFDKEGKLVHKEFMSCSTPESNHHCPKPARYVLEVLPSDAANIEIGDRIK